MEQKTTIYLNTDSSIKLIKNNVWKPFASYTYYLLARIFKMPSTYIFLGITLVAMLFIAALPVLFDAQRQLLMIPMMATLLCLIGIVLSGTFGISKSLNIFADFESDGTELLIIAKPITRKQVLVAKFIFLAVIGLLFSALITLLSFIGIAIVGLDTYNAVTSVDDTVTGLFVSTIIAFYIMGLTAIAFGIKFSGKAARALPTALSSISTIIAMLGVNLIGVLIQNPTGDVVNEMNNALTTKLQTQDQDKKLKFEVKDKDTDAKIEYNILSLNLSSAIGTNPIGNVEKNGVNYFYIDTMYFSYGNISDPTTIQISQLSARSVFAKTSPEDAPNDNLANYTAMYNLATAAVLPVFQKFNMPASGATVINFLNPVSAFLAIAGTTVFMPQTLTGTIPFTVNYDNFIEGGELESFIYDERNTYTLPSSLIAQNSFKVDQPWVVGLVWLGIFGMLATFTVVSYFRKDFK